jgi:tRNA U38,U39,U40 pseudouridine synthase TruA
MESSKEIVSALVKVGKGELDRKEIKEALVNPTQKANFGIAQAEGLMLANIEYKFEFTTKAEVRTKIYEELGEKIKRKETDLLIYRSIREGIG